MTEEFKRNRGGQPGNQNARKHGFYSRVLDDEQKRNLKYAASLKGIDEEIALLRVELISIVQHDPDNIRLISQAAGLLSRLLRTRKILGHNGDFSMQQAAENVIRDIGIPLLGVDLPRYLTKKPE
jgi:hypothetical protein